MAYPQSTFPMMPDSNDADVQYFELSPIQQAIWFDQIARPHSSVYNIGGRLMIFGQLDYALLEQALQMLVEQNDALRLTIDYGNERILQSVRKHLDVQLPLLDMSNAADPEAAAADWLQDRFSECFAIGKDMVYWQFALVKIADAQHALLTKYHHLFADGWSTKVVIDRLAELYNALLEGRKMAMPEVAGYRDFVEQERCYAQSDAYRRDAAFWLKHLPVLPEPLIPPKYPIASATETTRAHLKRFYLDRGFYDRLTAWALEHQATTYHVLLSALCLYFARIRQQSQVTVGIPVLNRSGARFKKVLGVFAGLSPLVITIDPDSNPSQLLRHVSASIRQLHKHQRYPLTAIAQRLQLLKNQRESLFDLVMSYEKQDYAVRFGEAVVNAKQLFSGVARYPLAVTVCEFSPGDDVEIVLEGAETCFKPDELDLLARRLQFVLRQLIATPAVPLAEIDLVPDEEKAIIFRRFNSPQPLPAFVSVIAQFRQWVARQPEAIALEQGQRRLTYGQLDELSDRLGEELSQRGCRSGDIVAVCMPRCLEGIVGLLAIFKLRAVYLPIDSDSPNQRIEGLLRQSRARLLLMVDANSDRLSGLHDNILQVDCLAISRREPPLHTEEQSPDDLAYLMYTSGSSGLPKGVMIHHSALSARLAWLQQAFAITPDDRVGQSIQSHFDPSMIEILLALTQGACLVLAPWQRLTAEAIAEFVVTSKINALALVPSSLRLLLQGLPDSADIALRVACCGGEILPANLAKAFIERTGARLYNVYGPTETTILASAWACGSDDASSLPLGKPLDQTQIFIVDSRLKLLPLAVPGEIVIGGAGVGRGYFEQAGMTELAFVPNPYAEREGERLYRSGDGGYIGTDGLLYFSERLDRQVKISGYRIEPAEIENVLLQVDGVKRAAVVSALHCGQKCLMAYVEASGDGGGVLQTALSAYLRQRLPDYMQPRAIVVLESIPLTPVGKIAYDLLPLPELTAKTQQAKRPPASGLETRLLAVWRQILKNPHLGPEDSFFEQNTDSLTAISLLAAMEAM
ncbi:MAG: amino acid adenylation domain-containing protein, partial [Methylomonas sp.]|nr:amino acid adenylation domain-containing protein [Methylomonas sp.]